MLLAGGLVLIMAAWAAVLGFWLWFWVLAPLGVAFVLFGFLLRGLDNVSLVSGITLRKLGAAIRIGALESFGIRPAVQVVDPEEAALRAEYARLERMPDAQQVHEGALLQQASLAEVMVARGMDPAPLRLSHSPVHAGMGLLGRVAGLMTPLGQAGVYLRLALVLGPLAGFGIQTWRIGHIKTELGAAREALRHEKQDKLRVIEANRGLTARAVSAETAAREEAEARRIETERVRQQLAATLRRNRKERTLVRDAQAGMRRASNEGLAGADQRSDDEWLRDIGIGAAGDGHPPVSGVPDPAPATGDPNGVPGRAGDGPG